MIDTEELRRLVNSVSPSWCVYSEPEVGLASGLFSGHPGFAGFGPIEPLEGRDLELAAMAPDLARGYIAQSKRIAELEAALRSVLGAPKHPIHDGYDDQGDFVWVEAVRIDDDSFALARAALTGKEG